MAVKFQNVYILRPGYDISKIMGHIEGSVVYLTSGYENDETKIMLEIVRGMSSFDPKTDVIISVGNASMNAFMIACVLTSSNSANCLNLAIWRDYDYHFIRVDRGSYEILE